MKLWNCILSSSFRFEFEKGCNVPLSNSNSKLQLKTPTPTRHSNFLRALVVSVISYLHVFTFACSAVTYDIVIYGSSSAAISAAVQAKRMGKSAVVVSPETRIGGLTTGGLGQTDFGNKSAFGGIALEFYRDVAVWYANPAHWKQQSMAGYNPDGQCSGTKGSSSMWTFER